jgi:hypothetical protein
LLNHIKDGASEGQVAADAAALASMTDWGISFGPVMRTFNFLHKTTSCFLLKTRSDRVCY